MNNKIQLRNGLPTKKYIQQLCEDHSLITNYLDRYLASGKITYSNRHLANENAEIVVAALRAIGLEVSLRHANREQALTGCITIERK